MNIRNYRIFLIVLIMSGLTFFLMFDLMITKPDILDSNIHKVLFIMTFPTLVIAVLVMLNEALFNDGKKGLHYFTRGIGE